MLFIVIIKMVHINQGASSLMWYLRIGCCLKDQLTILIITVYMLIYAVFGYANRPRGFLRNYGTFAL